MYNCLLMQYQLNYLGVLVELTFVKLYDFKSFISKNPSLLRTAKFSPFYANRKRRLIKKRGHFFIKRKHNLVLSCLLFKIIDL